MRFILSIIVASAIGLSLAGVCFARDLEDYLEEAEGLYWDTRYYEALDVAEDAITWFPESAEARSMTGRILFKIARFEEARERFEEAIELDTYGYWGHQGLGMYFLALGVPHEAKDRFETARRIWPGNELSYLMLARASEETDQFGEAYEWMAQAIALMEEQGRTAPRSLEVEAGRLAYLSERESWWVSPAFVETTAPMIEGRPIVHVRLGPDAEGVFLLDTAGSRGVIVHPALVFRAPGDRIASLDDIGPGIRTASYLFLLDRLEIGELTIRDVPCLVTERLPLAGVDGVIGLPLLRRFSWTFDFQRSEITIRDPAVAARREIRFGRDRVTSRVYSGGPLMVPVLLDRQRPATLVLDSVSDAVSLDHEFFEREVEGFIPLGQRHYVDATDNPHGALPVVTFELSSIWVEDEQILEGLIVRTYSMEDARRWTGVASPGILGMGALEDWVIDLDFAAGTVTLVRP